MGKYSGTLVFIAGLLAGTIMQVTAGATNRMVAAALVAPMAAALVYVGWCIRADQNAQKEKDAYRRGRHDGISATLKTLAPSAAERRSRA